MGETMTAEETAATPHSELSVNEDEGDASHSVTTPAVMRNNTIHDDRPDADGGVAHGDEAGSITNDHPSGTVEVSEPSLGNEKKEEEEEDGDGDSKGDHQTPGNGKVDLQEERESNAEEESSNNNATKEAGSSASPEKQQHLAQTKAHEELKEDEDGDLIQVKPKQHQPVGEDCNEAFLQVMNPPMVAATVIPMERDHYGNIIDAIGDDEEYGVSAEAVAELLPSAETDLGNRTAVSGVSSSRGRRPSSVLDFDRLQQVAYDESMEFGVPSGGAANTPQEASEEDDKKMMKSKRFGRISNTTLVMGLLLLLLIAIVAVGVVVGLQGRRGASPASSPTSTTPGEEYEDPAPTDPGGTEEERIGIIPDSPTASPTPLFPTKQPSSTTSVPTCTTVYSSKAETTIQYFESGEARGSTLHAFAPDGPFVTIVSTRADGINWWNTIDRTEGEPPRVYRQPLEDGLDGRIPLFKITSADGSRLFVAASNQPQEFGTEPGAAVYVYYHPESTNDGDDYWVKYKTSLSLFGGRLAEIHDMSVSSSGNTIALIYSDISQTDPIIGPTLRVFTVDVTSRLDLDEEEDVTFTLLGLEEISPLNANGDLALDRFTKLSLYGVRGDVNDSEDDLERLHLTVYTTADQGVLTTYRFNRSGAIARWNQLGSTIRIGTSSSVVLLMSSDGKALIVGDGGAESVIFVYTWQTLDVVSPVTGFEEATELGWRGVGQFKLRPDFGEELPEMDLNSGIVRLYGLSGDGRTLLVASRFDVPQSFEFGEGFQLLRGKVYQRDFPDQVDFVDRSPDLTNEWPGTGSITNLFFGVGLDATGERLWVHSQDEFVVYRPTCIASNDEP